MKSTLLALLVFLGGHVLAAEPSFKAGIAKVNITPSEYMWMAGYGGRNKIAEGKTHDLFAKAIAIEDANGYRLVLVTTDLIGLSRSISNDVFAGVAKATNLKREQLLLNSSHTHSGPVVRDNLEDMYDLTPAQRTQVIDYTATLKTKLIEVTLAAIKNLQPAKLSHGEGSALFAMNRREKTDKGVINGKNREGPVDHSVPVLKVEVGGKLTAVVFGYACHNTTLSYYKWCGDYAGFAQYEVEKAHPGVTALYWIGCGGDSNPQPRGTEELCIQHGKELASGVNKALAGELKPITGKLAATYGETQLMLDGKMTKEKLKEDSLSKTFVVRTRAARLLKNLDETGKIMNDYPYYPIHVWSLGEQITMVGLGGEVVLDYAIRLKKELPGNRKVWVAGYCNDVMAYIPTKRQLAEGGYEPDSSMLYYGMPGKWADDVEERIITRTKELAQTLGK